MPDGALTDGDSDVTRPLDLAGLWCAVGYGALAWVARQPGEPPLLAFFGLAAWTGLPVFGLFFHFRGRDEAFPFARMFAWAALFRLCGMLGGPFYEDDYFRYLWDGYRFATAGSPYGTAPEDFFADEQVPPEFQRVLDGVNHPELPTIYAPTTQVVFLAAFWLKPASIAALQAILICVDLLVLALLVRLAPGRAVMLYAWCPLVVKEVAFTAHPDGVGICLLLAGIVLARRHRWCMSAICLGLSAGAKVLALVVIPLVLAGGKARHWLLCGLTLAAIYAPFAVTGGAGLASLQTFAREWEFNSALYGLVAHALNPFDARVLLSFTYLGLWSAYGFRFMKDRPQAVPRGDWLYGLLLAVSPVVNPWYLLWLLPFAVVYPSAWAWTASSAVLLSYVTGLNLHDFDLQPYDQPLWVRLTEYGAILLALGFGLYRHRIARANPECSFRSERPSTIASRRE